MTEKLPSEILREHAETLQKKWLPSGLLEDLPIESQLKLSVLLESLANQQLNQPPANPMQLDLIFHLVTAAYRPILDRIEIMNMPVSFDKFDKSVLIAKRISLTSHIPHVSTIDKGYLQIDNEAEWVLQAAPILTAELSQLADSGTLYVYVPAILEEVDTSHYTVLIRGALA